VGVRRIFKTFRLTFRDVFGKVHPVKSVETLLKTTFKIFAHFVLVTLNRLFADRADIELNPGQVSTSQSPDPASPVRQTNFKNCIPVLDPPRVEGLKSFSCFTSGSEESFSGSSLLSFPGGYQGVRPNRSFLRRSMRPETKLRPSKEKRRR